MKHKEYEIKDGLKYHVEHTWVRSEGSNIITIGWTDFAQNLATELTSVKMPEEGESLNKDKYMGTIESGKWVGKIYAPVDGEVIELNEDVMDDPKIINEDPYGQGWLMKVKITDPGQIEELLDPSSYTSAIDSKLLELNG